MPKAIGAPEEIRTPDPQIRSRDRSFESKGLSCKPNANPAKKDQSVTTRFANRGSGPQNPEGRNQARVENSNGLQGTGEARNATAMCDDALILRSLLHLYSEEVARQRHAITKKRVLTNDVK